MTILLQALYFRHDFCCDGYLSKKDPDDGPLSRMEACIDIKQTEDKAKKGDRDSQHILGILAGWGRHINSAGNECYCLSREWHKKAASQMCKDSFYELGRLYQLGRCVEQSLLNAKILYTAAAKYGHMEAKYRLLSAAR